MQPNQPKSNPTNLSLKKWGWIELELSVLS